MLAEMCYDHFPVVLFCSKRVRSMSCLNTKVYKASQILSGEIALGLTSAQSEAALQQPSLHHPLAMAALRSRDRQSSSSKASTGVELGGVRDLLTLLDALVCKVASMTLMEYEEVEEDQPLSSYGLDSMVLVELRNWIRRKTDVDISVARIGEAENMEALAEMMLK